MALRPAPAAPPPKPRPRPPRRTGSKGVRPAAWEADLAPEAALELDARRFVQGMAWAAAISAPFWLAVLAAFMWL